MRILRAKDVKEKTGLPESTLYMMINRDQFPAPIRLGARTTGWIEEEIDDWLVEKINERDALRAEKEFV